MALLSVIRRRHFREHLSIRAIARRAGLSRNTIRKYLRSDAVSLCSGSPIGPASWILLPSGCFPTFGLRPVSPAGCRLCPRSRRRCGGLSRSAASTNSCGQGWQRLAISAKRWLAGQPIDRRDPHLARGRRSSARRGEDGVHDGATFRAACLQDPRAVALQACRSRGVDRTSEGRRPPERDGAVSLVGLLASSDRSACTCEMRVRAALTWEGP